MTVSTGERPHPAPEVLESWRTLLTVAARSLDVSVGLVMRVTQSALEVAAASVNPENPYAEGDLCALALGVPCERVVTTRTELDIWDARTESEWADGPDAQLGLNAYLGYPVYWPDGDVFGTICILDHAPRDFSDTERCLLLCIRDAVHDSLAGGCRSADAFARPTSPTGVVAAWDLDPSTGVLRMSPWLAQQFGVPAEDPVMSLTAWLARFRDECREPVRARIEDLLAARVRTTDFACPLSEPPVTRLARFFARSVHDAEGTVVLVVGLCTVEEAPAQAACVTDAEAYDREPGIWLELDVDGAPREVSEDLLRLLPCESLVQVANLLPQLVDPAFIRAATRRLLTHEVEREIVLLRPVGAGPTLVGELRRADGAAEPRVRLSALPPSAVIPESVPSPYATHDPITGLPVRPVFETWLRHAMATLPDEPARGGLAIAVVDVANIREVARVDGLAMADRLLAHLGDQLARTAQLVASLGYGYFAVLAPTTGGRTAEEFRATVAAQVAGLPQAGIVRPVVETVVVDAATALSSSLSDVFDAHVIGAAHLGAADLRAGHLGAEADHATGPGAWLASRPRPAVVEPLSTRQKEIAQLVAAGMSNREIAEQLFIAVRTVEGHLDGIREKLGASSRTQIVVCILSNPDLVAGVPPVLDLGETRLHASRPHG